MLVGGNRYLVDQTSCVQVGQDTPVIEKVPLLISENVYGCLVALCEQISVL